MKRHDSPGSNPELVAAVSEAASIGVIQPATMTFMYNHALPMGIEGFASSPANRTG